MGRLSGYDAALKAASRFSREWRERPAARLASALRTSLVWGAAIGLVQPSFAMGIDSSAQPQLFPTSGQGIYAALLDLDQSGPATAQRADDGDAVASLASFARTIGAPKAAAAKLIDQKAAAAIRGDDTVFAELANFATSVGAAASEAREPKVRVADADSLFDALKDFSQRNSSAPVGAPPPPVVVKPARVVDAHIVGDKVCVTCHATHAVEFSKTLMGRIGKTQPGKFACENCHGAGSEHVKLGGGRGVGGIISFRSNDTTRSVSENNAMCLACHERGDRTYWSGSTHETRNVACTDCHTIMKPVSQKFALKTVYEPETCYQCHKDKRAQMARSSHMPVREGKMVCSDCHNPHGTANEGLLKTATINDTCYKCHAEKRGPFLFEHSPVRENCLNCHDPHGSINEFMLKVSRPRLCSECHGMGHGPTTPASGPNTIISISRACNNCHTQVHGTNSPSGALLHR
jgi:DmsE family decaheme c-type cytochrome